jgi:hypothetical protein
LVRLLHKEWAVNLPAARVTPLLATGFALLCSLGPLAAASSSADGYQLIVARFNTTVPPAYKAYRRLEAGNPGSSKQGWLEAWTEFHPGRGLTVEIVSEGRIGIRPQQDPARHAGERTTTRRQRQAAARGGRSEQLPL